MSLWPQIILSGIVAGSVYALVALGFVLIYKATNVIHFGLGEQVSLGAYLVIIVQISVGTSFWPAVIVALVLAGLFGFLIERLVLRPIADQPVLVQIIATLAVGLCIREGLRGFMGPHPWPFPALLSTEPLSFAGVYFNLAGIAIVFVSITVMLILYVIFTHTKFGQAILAVCQNPVGASLMGIPVPSMLSAVWILASVLAAIAGILLAPLVTLSPEMGLIGIKGFVVAVIGGFTSLPGAIVGGFLLGIIETAMGTFISTAVKDATTYALLILLVILWPHGLFGHVFAKKV